MSRQRALSQRALHIAFAAIAYLGVAPVVLADLQDDMNARWRGAWVIITGDIYSNCNSSRTNNRINGDLVSGNGRHAFEPGELARVTRVDVRRRRVDVFLDVQESLLLPYQDGPFTLYREVSCPVELLLEYGDTRTRDLGVAGVEEQFNVWFERYSRRADAEASPAWNKRMRDDYPVDYEATLAEYEVWKIEQHNLLVAEKKAYSVEQTGYLLAQVSSDSDYGAGLSYGIAAMRENLTDDCDSLVASQPSTFASSYDAPNPDWANGYKTGQELAYHIEMSRRLDNCFIDPPVTYAYLD